MQDIFNQIYDIILKYDKTSYYVKINNSTYKFITPTLNEHNESLLLNMDICDILKLKRYNCLYDNHEWRYDETVEKGLNISKFFI